MGCGASFPLSSRPSTEVSTGGLPNGNNRVSFLVVLGGESRALQTIIATTDVFFNEK
jgi:hypothetical protein